MKTMYRIKKDGSKIESIQVEEETDFKVYWKCEGNLRIESKDNPYTEFYHDFESAQKRMLEIININIDLIEFKKKQMQKNWDLVDRYNEDSCPVRPGEYKEEDNSL